MMRHRSFFLLVVAVAAVSAFAPSRKAALSPRFNHVMLYVSNLDSSITFYTKAFDLQVAQRIDSLTVTGANGSPVTRPARMALLKFPGQEFVLELAQRPAGSGVSPHYQHLGIDVLDIEAAAERAKAAGARDFSGIQTVRAPGTVAKNAFFKGPSGELLELMQVMSGAF
jgi:catechol 2,3-dioxygenase-like lactoylglutathione lyase family enzyme